jgi:hypothetical protein
VRLIHDVLDTQVVDARGRPTGKVDGIILELCEERPPRVIVIEIGGLTLATQ